MNLYLKILLFISVFHVAFSCSNKPDKYNEEHIVKYEVQDLDVVTFQNKLSNSNGILLDVRTEEEISQGYIPGASFINLYDEKFNQKIGFIQKEKPVFVYCKMGGRSAKAAKELINIGFKQVYNLNGGIQAWYNNGNEIIQDSLFSNTVQEFTIDEYNKIVEKITKPTVVCFQTKWCLPCKKMNSILSELSDSLKGELEFLKIDIDRNINIANELNVESVPTFVGLLDGNEIWRKVGFVEKKDFLKLILNLKK